MRIVLAICCSCFAWLSVAALPISLPLLQGTAVAEPACPCVLHNLLNGKCIKRDPICEALDLDDKVRLPDPPIIPVPVPLPPAPDPMRDLQTLQSCFNDPSRCPAQVLGNATYQSFSGAIDYYISDLQRQARGEWQRLPSDFVSAFASHFRGLNLNNVRFAEHIDTKHGQAITIGYEIFFPDEVSLSNREGVELMLHEIQHVVQYQQRGGARAFIAEYVAKVPAEVVRKRSFDVHDSLDIERAAASRARDLVDRVYGWDFEITNACRHPIRLALGYRDHDEAWVFDGYWEIDSESSVWLADDDGRIHSTNGVYYLWAEATNGAGLVWKGDISRRLANGNTHNFFEKRLGDSATSFNTELTCKTIFHGPLSVDP